ncbi:hypothetical protein Ahy_B02g058685 [Arachis hypogaea]|uniref:Uncharacterized protein n=1 Tax=Arachis hypogaea TaxID=3818 RepID=A0A445AF40_ARAHY|nr:hypothetical protein Ahy_B02g058685 [Arachis hypogaea]
MAKIGETFCKQNSFLLHQDVVRFQIVEVFAHVPKDEVENRIENMKEVTSQKLTKLDEEKQSVVAQMAKLKKILYGKFKDSINLEEDSSLLLIPRGSSGGRKGCGFAPLALGCGKNEDDEDDEDD